MPSLEFYRISEMLFTNSCENRCFLILSGESRVSSPNPLGMTVPGLKWFLSPSMAELLDWIVFCS